MSTHIDIPVARCKSCNAEVIWAAMVKKDGTPGKMPFDKDPDEGGHYCLTRRGDGTIHATYVKRGEDFPTGGLPRVSHFSTCPHADKHRRPS